MLYYNFKLHKINGAVTMYSNIRLVQLNVKFVMIN